MLTLTDRRSSTIKAGVKLMDNQLILHLKTGQTVEGNLARIFGTNDSDIEIFSEYEQRKLLFALDEICDIRFTRNPVRVAIDEPTSIEEIQTIVGRTFRVAVFTKRKFHKGILSLHQDENTPYRSIFFTFSGIRYRREVRRISKILEERGLVTDSLVNEALAIQEKLHTQLIGEIIAETAELTHEHIEKQIEKAARKPEHLIDARVGDILVEAGLVTREQAETAYRIQQNNKKFKVGEILIKMGLITEEQLLSALATKFRMRFIDLDGMIPTMEALKALSEGLVSQLQVFPIEYDGHRLVVATASPTDMTVGDRLRFCSKYNIELVIAPSKQISSAIEKYYHQQREETFTDLEGVMDEALAVIVEEEKEDPHIVEPDSVVIALINRILIEAFKREASDIHFEPNGSNNPVLVRFRIDGECMVVHRIAASYKNAIIARIKIISGLDITERRRPQSGKIFLRFEQHKLEYRVEITPIAGGQESAVLRLFGVSEPLPLSEMGLMPYNLERFMGIIDKPFGMILCVGPTGSGKTTTLHSALSYINTPTRKIWTAEDPVEITQPGLCQVQVNSKIGFSFADALRSFLRADPDVIMIGEMRDIETAKIAIESSLTGHLVFSTLHTNSSPETVVRLIEMGMDPFNFADALLGIMGQRLARALCDNCKKSRQPERGEYDDLMDELVRICGRIPDIIPPYEETVFMEKTGCEQCDWRGYRGRLAIHELMLGTPQIKRAIREKRGAGELKMIAIEEGMWTLRMDGIMKVFKGLTDLEQIRKVCI